MNSIASRRKGWDVPDFLNLGEDDYERIVAPALQGNGFPECRFLDYTRALIAETRPLLWVEANEVYLSRDGKSISLLLQRLVKLRGAGPPRPPFTLGRKYRSQSQGENRYLRQNCTSWRGPFRYTRSKQRRQSHVSKGAP
jgi:hypothetical protein